MVSLDHPQSKTTGRNKDTEFVKLLASPEDQQRFEGLTSRLAIGCKILGLGLGMIAISCQHVGVAQTL